MDLTCMYIYRHHVSLFKLASGSFVLLRSSFSLTFSLSFRHCLHPQSLASSMDVASARLVLSARPCPGFPPSVQVYGGFPVHLVYPRKVITENFPSPSHYFQWPLVGSPSPFHIKMNTSGRIWNGM